MFEPMLECCRSKDRNLLCVVETDSLELSHESELFRGKCECFSNLEEVGEGDAMQIAKDVVVHAMDQEKTAELGRLAANVDIV